MNPNRKLARFAADEVQGAYQITLESDDGESLQVLATAQQIEELMRDLDELLGRDAEGEDEVTERLSMGDE
ncbi:hypothetical protein [Methylobacterium oxalidis]|uniref:Uncharacterized protein n=1 Tax=Methylobacterium oxalidis TaxID=944322 RepID=A0A512JCK8_9HYPH|nr:hypothetical protein [Methylobacterium oxalidis]GEP07710.1 hypothetical protein MOX02_57480 [Methylobacterium oxalidis]GJE35808.1 hypothetical protein LDDCCGHA_6028 [Methylobacterium oxalidis]GLS62256.1 hypothetical protein GCM10007888_06370 [Methylobacterium oxalidis]